MIRFDARGAYLLFGRRGDSAYLKQDGNQGRARTVFFKNQQNVRNKALMFIWKARLSKSKLK